MIKGGSDLTLPPQSVDKVVAGALAPATLFFSDEIFGYK